MADCVLGNAPGGWEIVRTTGGGATPPTRLGRMRSVAARGRSPTISPVAPGPAVSFAIALCSRRSCSTFSDKDKWPVGRAGDGLACDPRAVVEAEAEAGAELCGWL